MEQSSIAGARSYRQSWWYQLPLVLVEELNMEVKWPGLINYLDCSANDVDNDQSTNFISTKFVAAGTLSLLNLLTFLTMKPIVHPGIFLQPRSGISGRTFLLPSIYRMTRSNTNLVRSPTDPHTAFVSAWALDWIRHGQSSVCLILAQGWAWLIGGFGVDSWQADKWLADPSIPETATKLAVHINGIILQFARTEGRPYLPSLTCRSSGRIRNLRPFLQPLLRSEHNLK